MVAIKMKFSAASVLLTKPTLVWYICSSTSGKWDFIISYLTEGLVGVQIISYKRMPILQMQSSDLVKYSQ